MRELAPIGRRPLPLLLLALVMSADGAADEPPFSLPAFRFHSEGSTLAAHRALGEAMGRSFAAGAKARLEEWPALQNSWLPALQRPAVRELYEAFLEANTAAYPEYVEELRGIAAGASLTFEAVFIAQIAQEFAAMLPSVAGAAPPSQTVQAATSGEDHCSDYMLCSAEVCFDGHNEDGDPNSINRTFLADIQLGPADRRFLAFVYMGELPSGAFGVNAHGVGFSLNWVGPPAALAPGLGRGFVSRSLLDARDADDALARATRRGQSGGHNIQLFDFCRRGISNVEVAQDRFAVRNIGSDAFFHANQYQTLDVPGQTIWRSSAHRLARVAALPKPRTAAEALGILGDQGDELYPIFHDRASHSRGELSDWTLASVLFDLDDRRVTILEGNPRNQRVRAEWSVSDLAAPHGCVGGRAAAEDAHILVA